MPPRYPMMLDVSRRLIVIIGGGAVGARKARGVLDAGAQRVRVISPSFHDDMPAAVERVPRAFQAGDLAGAGLVFAATDSPTVNDAVVREARAAGVLVCRADGSEEVDGDFITPAKLVRGEITLTVSAGSAALAALVRDRLAEQLDPRWERLAAAMTRLRPAILGDATLTPQQRRAMLRKLASDEATGVLESDGEAGLLRWARPEA